MKSIKKFTSLFLALVMLVGVLSVTALADDEYTVTIYVQEAERNADDQVVWSYAYPETISVQVPAGSTLKNAIDLACTQPGSIITNPVWNPENDQYLKSLDVNGVPYENADDYGYDPDTGKIIYTGFSWLYFYGSPEDMPASFGSYPDTTLGETVVKANTIITLSFESLTFEYE